MSTLAADTGSSSHISSSWPTLNLQNVSRFGGGRSKFVDVSCSVVSCLSALAIDVVVAWICVIQVLRAFRTTLHKRRRVLSANPVIRRVIWKALTFWIKAFIPQLSETLLRYSASTVMGCPVTNFFNVPCVICLVKNKFPKKIIKCYSFYFSDRG